MSAESGANIVLRDSHHKVDKAKKLIHNVIETATSTPEHDNQRKIHQLRDLVIMNRTFRDDESRQHQGHANRLLETSQDGQPCSNPHQQPGSSITSPLDREYQQFMMELDTNHGLSSSDGVHAPSLQWA
ncbi:hypothetical protein NW754_014673 [Fusarium falciforme]|nr:hypothetical protein NW754_014673 [Fusarium falciforme]